MNQTQSKLTNDICLLSKHGVCLMDMAQVVEKATELGLTLLAETVATDLSENKITDGAYYPIIANLYGVTS
jgi:hypothetical protein